MSGAWPGVGLVQGGASPVFGSPGNPDDEICNVHRCMMVFVFCCMCLATYLPLPPSLPTCLHAYIACTHALHYAHIPIRTCIQIHAPDIQHIHRHTVHIYTYLHIHPYTSIYIHIHACACIPIYIYMDHKDLRYIHTDPCAPVNGARKLFDHTSGQFSLHERLDS